MFQVFCCVVQRSSSGYPSHVHHGNHSLFPGPVRRTPRRGAALRMLVLLGFGAASSIACGSFTSVSPPCSNMEANSSMVNASPASSRSLTSAEGRRDRILWCLRVLFEVGAQSPRFRTERLRLFPGLGNPLSQSAVVSIHVFDRLKKRSTGSVEVVEYVLLFLVDGEHGLELKKLRKHVHFCGQCRCVLMV